MTRGKDPDPILIFLPADLWFLVLRRELALARSVENVVPTSLLGNRTNSSVHGMNGLDNPR